MLLTFKSQVLYYEMGSYRTARGERPGRRSTYVGPNRHLLMYDPARGVLTVQVHTTPNDI